jgi:PRC-barrel domain protein
MGHTWVESATPCDSLYAINLKTAEQLGLSAPPALIASTDRVIGWTTKGSGYGPQAAILLVDKSGKITGLVIGVGGFLGVGEKDVIVPFGSVKTAKKDDKWWLTLDETKDDLKKAPGFKYDRTSTTWVSDKK